MFVTFEGPEGAGKSTALRTIAQRLMDANRQVVTTREPGGGPLGKRIRQMLLEEGAVSPETEVLLFLADRANHVETIIRPALAKGKVVLCDRHADSTIVYQGYGRGLDLGFLKQGNAFATKSLVPDLTLLFDLDPEVGLSRLNLKQEPSTPSSEARADVNRLDREPLEFHKKVRAGFLELAKQEPQRFHVLDATKAPSELADDAFDAIFSRLGG